VVIDFFPAISMTSSSFSRPSTASTAVPSSVLLVNRGRPPPDDQPKSSIIAIDRRVINSVLQPMFPDALFFSTPQSSTASSSFSGVQDDPIIIKRFA
jgi:hypothetical protein